MQKEAAYYLGLKNKRQIQWEALIGENGRIKEWENAYFLRHYEDTSSSMREQMASYRHTDTVAFDYINQSIAMMTVPTPVRTFYADDMTSKKARDVMDAAEKYVAGAWRCNRARVAMDPLRAILFDQLVRTGAFVYVYVDEARLKLYRKATGLPRDAYFPIVIECLSPRTCLPDPMPGRWAWTDSFMRAEQMHPREAVALWGEKVVRRVVDDQSRFEESLADISDESALDMVDVWEFVPGESGEPELWNGVVYGSDWVRKPKNVSLWYKDMPVVYIPALDTPAEELVDRRLSPLMPVMHNYRTLERIVNRIMTTATYQADPTILYRTNKAKDVPKGPGQVITLDSDESLTYLQGMGASPQLLQVFQLVSGDLERSSLARANYGNAPGSWSGYALNQAITGSALKNQPIADNLRRGLSAIDQRILDLTVAVFGKDNETVTAYGHLRGSPYKVKIKAKDLEGLMVDTALSPKAPADEQTKAGLAQMYRTPGPGGKPLASDNWIRRNVLTIEDAKAVEDEIYMEQIEASPTLTKYSILAVLDKHGLPPEVVKAVKAELEQQMGMRPGGGAQGEQQGGPPGGQQAGAEPGMAAGAPPQGTGAPQGITPEQLTQVIEEGMRSGELPPAIGQAALQALQQRMPVDQVIQAIQQAMQQGGEQQSPAAPPQPGAPQQMQPPAMAAGGPEAMQAPMPPQGMQPPAGQQPMMQEPQTLREKLEYAVAQGILPGSVGQILMQVLDQGAPEEQVTQMAQWAAQALDQGASEQEVVAQLMEAMQGGPTPEEAAAYLQQFGDEAVTMFQARLSEGMSVEEALQATVAAAAGAEVPLETAGGGVGPPAMV